MKKLLIAAITILLSTGIISAQEIDDIEGSINDDSDRSSRPSSVSEFMDYNKSNNAKSGLSFHKYNYILPFTYSSYGKERDKKEVKFQLSIKQRVFRFYGWAFYFAYSQKSFQQAYSFSQSRPFRENNFNPEFFLRTKTWTGIRTDFGVEHESNGQSELKSRSWNRIYITPYYENSHLIAYLKTWYRFKEKKKDAPEDPEGDDNTDIHKYYGYGELGFTLKIPEFNNIYLSTVSRYNFIHKKGSTEVNITIPLTVNNLNIIAQYWYGYGESLIDYNIKQSKLGIGINFTR